MGRSPAAGPYPAPAPFHAPDPLALPPARRGLMRGERGGGGVEAGAGGGMGGGRESGAGGWRHRLKGPAERKEVAIFPARPCPPPPHPTPTHPHTHNCRRSDGPSPPPSARTAPNYSFDDINTTSFTTLLSAQVARPSVYRPKTAHPARGTAAPTRMRGGGAVQWPAAPWPPPDTAGRSQQPAVRWRRRRCCEAAPVQWRAPPPPPPPTQPRTVIFRRVFRRKKLTRMGLSRT